MHARERTVEYIQLARNFQQRTGEKPVTVADDVRFVSAASRIRRRTRCVSM